MLEDPALGNAGDQLRRSVAVPAGVEGISGPEAKDFNDNLRQSFRRETELLLDSILREDRSVVDLLNADYTFVDERWRSSTGFPTFAAAGSAASRCRMTRGADCWARRVFCW